MNIPTVSVVSDSSLPASSGTGAAVPQTKSAQSGTAVGSQTGMGNEQIQNMVAEMQQNLGAMGISVNFTRYGERNEKIAVVVSDQSTGKVIREIPPKELQQLYVKMNELIGMIFNGSA